ncbi:MAG: carboxypeptidase-like regulatory domain-containing protein [Cyanobacteriota bacterium]|nr:carboxypeptidase-like regulatory domain-containing protein [Cyanobacteriota bacterium]
MWIQPFFDDNNNGKLDLGEKLYIQEPELLLLVNNQPLQSLRPEIRSHGIFLFLPPDTYRLDIDPAGFPLDWHSPVSAYGVEVELGSYTPVSIPLNLAYTVTGLVTDEEGNAVNGAKVEAISVGGDRRVFSITNNAGVFYLENLQQGSYNLLIDDLPAIPKTLILDESSKPFQEINLEIEEK